MNRVRSANGLDVRALCKSVQMRQPTGRFRRPRAGLRLGRVLLLLA